VTARKQLRAGDYFTRSWRLVPVRLAAQVQAALTGAGDFDAVRRPGAPTPGAAASRTTPAPSPASPRTPAPAILRVMSTNDFHGALEARPDGNSGVRGGAAHLATAIHNIAAGCSGSCVSVLVDGGDEMQGTPASNLAFGRPVIAFFNAVGYAASAVGNHDFDWGQDTLRARMRDAKYAMLAANVTHADGRPVPWLRADTIVERGGLRIGIIGLSTVQTPRVTMARNVADLRFREHPRTQPARARREDGHRRGARRRVVWLRGVRWRNGRPRPRYRGQRGCDRGRAHAHGVWRRDCRRPGHSRAVERPVRRVRGCAG
jgi:2',3'-cyclic-nucleotide 2'-phosphodiesterase (5'-nucleotidase family)